MAWNFKGRLDLQFYDDDDDPRLLYSCKEMGHGHIRFVGRAISLVSLASPFATQEARSDANTFVIKAPATIIMKGSINYSRLNEQLWTWPIARRTMGFLAATITDEDLIFSEKHCREEIILVDTSSVDAHAENGRRWEASAMATVFSA